MLIKLTGEVSLLPTETDKKWKKHLHRENGKWVEGASCDKISHGTMSTSNNRIVHRNYD